jgi:hypothetical protein
MIQGVEGARNINTRYKKARFKNKTLDSFSLVRDCILYSCLLFRPISDAASLIKKSPRIQNGYGVLLWVMASKFILLNKIGRSRRECLKLIIS